MSSELPPNTGPVVMPWLALAVAAGLVSIVASIEIVVGPFSMLGHERQREFLALDHGAWIGWAYLIATIGWLISLTLFIVSAVRWSRFRRSRPGARHPYRALRVIGWMLVIGAPLLTVTMGVVFGIVYSALAIMCGEAVSPNCGM